MKTIDKYQKYYDKIQAAAQGQATAIDESMVKESSSFAALRKKGAENPFVKEKKCSFACFIIYIDIHVFTFCRLW